jgi:hypothetical protein
MEFDQAPKIRAPAQLFRQGKPPKIRCNFDDMRPLRVKKPTCKLNKHLAIVHRKIKTVPLKFDHQPRIQPQMHDPLERIVQPHIKLEPNAL